jgi:hypothetical protein
MSQSGQSRRFADVAGRALNRAYIVRGIPAAASNRTRQWERARSISGPRTWARRTGWRHFAGDLLDDIRDSVGYPVDGALNRPLDALNDLRDCACCLVEGVRSLVFQLANGIANIDAESGLQPGIVFFGHVGTLSSIKPFLCTAFNLMAARDSAPTRYRAVLAPPPGERSQLTRSPPHLPAGARPPAAPRPPRARPHAAGPRRRGPPRPPPARRRAFPGHGPAGRFRFRP